MTDRAARRRRWLAPIAALVGLALGAVTVFGALYRKPGVKAVEKLQRMVGLVSSTEDLYAFGREEIFPSDRWTRVKSPSLGPPLPEESVRIGGMGSPPALKGSGISPPDSLPPNICVIRPCS